MPFVFRGRFRDIPPPTQRKGVLGAVERAVTAPGTELLPTPMSVAGPIVRKAGVPLVKRLLGGGKQAARTGRTIGPNERKFLLERMAPPKKAGQRSLVSEGGKGFAEQKFTTSLPVRVRFADGTMHLDEVKGLNPGHALARARDNWPGATVSQGGAPIRLGKKK